MYVYVDSYIGHSVKDFVHISMSGLLLHTKAFLLWFIYKSER